MDILFPGTTSSLITSSNTYVKISYKVLNFPVTSASISEFVHKTESISNAHQNTYDSGHYSLLFYNATGISSLLFNTVTCRVVCVTKMTGSSSDDWTY
jgi:hypothetical protein